MSRFFARKGKERWEYLFQCSLLMIRGKIMSCFEAIIS